MRLLLICLTFVGTLPWPASGFEQPNGTPNAPTGVSVLELGPPAPQLGDSEPYEITIGQAREAIWYKMAFGILWAEWKEKGVDYETLRTIYEDTLKELRRVAQANVDLEMSRDMWRGVAFIAGGLSVLAILTLVVVVAVVS